MIEPPQIVTTPATHTAVIRFDIPRAEMGKIFGPGVQELFRVLQAQGIAPAGALFAHHTRVTPERFTFELGVPVARPITAAGRVQPSSRPASRAARTVMHGDYRGLPAAWKEFTAWIEGQGARGASDLWECYAIGPADTPEPAGWRTELVKPLVEGTTSPART